MSTGEGGIAGAGVGGGVVGGCPGAQRKVCPGGTVIKEFDPCAPCNHRIFHPCAIVGIRAHVGALKMAHLGSKPPSPGLVWPSQQALCAGPLLSWSPLGPLAEASADLKSLLTRYYWVLDSVRVSVE